ncbi:MAG: CBS domain-containing protein [Myxococcota bacterium]|nr:CBS domain-containing protein [Myxococcota bacterium]
MHEIDERIEPLPADPAQIDPAQIDPAPIDPAPIARTPSDPLDAGGTQVRNVMQVKVVTISVTERLSTVEDIMTLGRLRHMPVVHGGRLVGVVSQRDLLRASLSELGTTETVERRAFLHAIEIAQVMSQPAISIEADASVSSAAQLMAQNRIGCLPVVEDERLVGMLTETDVLCWVAGAKNDALTPVTEPLRDSG